MEELLQCYLRGQIALSCVMAELADSQVCLTPDSDLTSSVALEDFARYFLVYVRNQANTNPSSQATAVAQSPTAPTNSHPEASTAQRSAPSLAFRSTSPPPSAARHRRTTCDLGLADEQTFPALGSGLNQVKPAQVRCGGLRGGHLARLHKCLCSLAVSLLQKRVIYLLSSPSSYPSVCRSKCSTFQSLSQKSARPVTSLLRHLFLQLPEILCF